MKSELVGERKLVSDKKPRAVGLWAPGAVELLVPEDDLEALRKIGSSQLKAGVVLEGAGHSMADQ